MKKFLTVMAVFGLVMFMAQVPAALAEVTFYGHVHLSVDLVNADDSIAGAPYDKNQIVVASNATRFGFKGEEKLDNGMNFFWQVETQIQMDGEPGQGDLAIRNRYLGVGGNFGKVLVGIYDTPYKIIGRKIELFPEYVGDARNITAVNAAGVSFDSRFNNMITYIAPKMANNIEIMAAYSTDTRTGVAAVDDIDDNDYTAMSASVTYTAGPLWLGFAYETHDLGPTLDEKGMRVTGSYDVNKDTKIVGFYQQLTDLGGASGDDRNDIGFGVSYAMGNNVLKAQYYKAGSVGTDDGGSVMAVAVDRKLSKNTTGYIAFAKADNDDNAAYIMNGPGDTTHGDATTTAAGGSPTAFSIGMIYKF